MRSRPTIKCRLAPNAAVSTNAIAERGLHRLDRGGVDGGVGLGRGEAVSGRWCRVATSSAPSARS